MKAPNRMKGERKPWGVISGAFFVLGLWLVVTVKLLPSQLDDVSRRLRNYEEQAEPDAGEGVVVKQPQRAPPSRPTPPPITMGTIIATLNSFLNELHEVYGKLKPNPDPTFVWELYKGAADRWLLPLDRTYIGHGLFPVRDDDSIFVSVASYRDELCTNTLKEMYSKAAAPEKLFVGLVMQNCRENCQTGVLVGGAVIDAPPDPDCYQEFCAAPEGRPWCAKGQVRLLFVNESESLGPAVARYFASKLWQGETYYCQIDSHSLFEKGWDAAFVQDIRRTPTFPKSVLSQYPADTHEAYQDTPGRRICDAGFSLDPIESYIIRLGGGKPNDDVGIPEKPCPAPFIGAGFMFAHASFLQNAPYDPYVPWVFMGEEILLSMRLWTWGFDIYAPTRNMVAHYYVREHKPKFWETVGRLFKTPGIHNDIHDVVIQRVKHIVGYPESSSEIVSPQSLLSYTDIYGEGKVRTMDLYMRTVGVDMVAKREVGAIDWCVRCVPHYPLR